MQLYSPMSTTPKRKAFRAPPLASLDGLRIGLLENGKLNADEMLREVAALFVERHGCTTPPPSPRRRMQARRRRRRP